MVELRIKKINYNFINYYNKLVFKKNLNFFIRNRKKDIFNVKFYLSRKRSYNVVTLRAPKHFKVGRHHYHIISKNYVLNTNFFLKPSVINNIDIFSYINKTKFFLKKKKISKIVSLLKSFVITISIKKKIEVC